MARYLKLTAAAALAAAILSGCTSCGSGGNASTDPNLPPVTRPAFDSARAWADLLAQEKMGPRTPGSAAHDQLQALLISEMEASADRTLQQKFTASCAFGGPYHFVNVIGCFSEAKSGRSLLLGCHWDSRPVSDHDPDPARRHDPCPGINDGASTVAVLLEVARALKKQPPDIPVYIVFLDAEDIGTDGSSLPYQGFCVGTVEFARQMDTLHLRPSQAIIIDMIGDQDLRINLEQNSRASNRQLQDVVFDTAAKLGHPAFVKEPGPTMIDDHIPLIQAGVPSIDLIDFDYPQWHTTQDTSAHCGEQSLMQVGDTLLEVIYSKP